MNLSELVKNSKYVVVFTGAGISTESGIPDFRSSSGLYATGEFAGHRPEEILSRRFFRTNKELFFKFYRMRLVMLDKQPNRAHYALAKLESIGKVKAVITQNIDNLHNLAGSQKVLDLHGNSSKCACMSCQQSYTGKQFVEMVDATIIPRCFCGGIVRPSTVLFDEWLDDDTYDAAVKEIKAADLVIAIGSSLVVQPAAGTLSERGDTCKFVIINNSETQYDGRADLLVRESCGEVLENLAKEY